MENLRWRDFMKTTRTGFEGKFPLDKRSKETVS